MSPRMLNYNIWALLFYYCFTLCYFSLLLLYHCMCSALQPVGKPTGHQAQITHHGLTDHFGLTTIVFVASNIIVHMC